MVITPYEEREGVESKRLTNYDELTLKFELMYPRFKLDRMEIVKERERKDILECFGGQNVCLHR